MQEIKSNDKCQSQNINSNPNEQMTREREDRPLIIPVFIPHQGCPHRCVFCDQAAITGISGATIRPDAIRDQVTFYLSSMQSKHATQIAFYGGNFLGLNDEDITSLLSEATSFVAMGRVDSIRFSTRPDTIDNAQLALLSPFPVQTIELGAQSMDDRVLAKSCRGHLAADTQKAVPLLKDKGYDIGIQLMVGLPGDDEGRSLETARQVVALAPDFVRIYPTVVLKNSPLAKLLERGEYAPWSLERTVALVKELVLVFKENKIPIIRMGLQASEDLDKGCHVLAGPYHPAFGHLVMSKMMFDNAIAAINQLDLPKNRASATIVLTVHPRSESQLRGMKNENMHLLKHTYGDSRFSIVLDETVAQGEVVVEKSVEVVR
jgi:histone acetyltransferase (RNA polymerase elongator complex component)